MYNQWDHEAKQLMADAEQLAIHTKALEQNLESGVPEQKIELETLQARFFDSIGKVKSQHIPPSLLNPRQHALVVWCHNYAEQLLQFYEKELRLLGKKMWMALVQTRVSGQVHEHRRCMSEDDLIDMAVRHEHLKKTERYLSNQLVTLNKQKQELKDQYREVELSFANQQAAQSLYGHFGSNSRDGLRHPVLNGLTQIVKQLTWPFRLSREEKVKFEHMQHQLTQRTETLVSQCQNEILHQMRPSNHTKTSTLPRRSQKSINDIDQLRSIYEHNVATAAERNVPTARPKVVKNLRNHATTL